MTSYYKDNIIAIATAPENGAIGVLRLSGPDALAIMKRIFIKPDGQAFAKIRPRYLHYGHLVNLEGDLLDQCLGAYMAGPHSFTGEDVVEWQCHGNLNLLKRAVEAILRLDKDFSLRSAGPGEFTKRAYLNGKLDLTQAEAVHELITASSDAAIEASLGNLDGRLASYINEIKEQLRISLALVEASFEFAEEDIQTFDIDEVQRLLKQVFEELGQLRSAFYSSKLYDQGVSVALVGEPNVGKSSLLNAILVEDRAIVTELAGTTRDVIDGTKLLGGLRFVFRDTAGLRQTEDRIESQGIERSLEWMRKSDIVCYVKESLDDPAPEVEKTLKDTGKPLIYIINKADLLFRSASDRGVDVEKIPQHLAQSDDHIVVSALSGFGLEKLEQKLLDIIDERYSVQNKIYVNQRQFRGIDGSLKVISQVIESIQTQSWTEEILAEELRQMICLLEDVTGVIDNEQVLGEIFERFCIGK